MNANFEGVYVAEDKDKKNLVEIYKVDGVFYGVGFASLDGTVSKELDSKNPNKELRTRTMTGSAFLSIRCVDEKTCKGRIYNFYSGKSYPIKARLNNDVLELKVDIIFAPTLRWEKLSGAKLEQIKQLRIDVKDVDLRMSE